MVPHAALLLLLLALGGTPRGPAPQTWEAPWDGESFRRLEDAASGLSLDVPFSGFHFEARHFPKATEEAPHRARHLLTLSGPFGAEITVDAWDLPDGQALDAWVEAHLPFLYEGNPALSSGRAGRRGVASLAFWHPRTGQSFSRRTSVFALGQQVIRVTCENAEDARAARLYERILESVDAAEASR
ncbi:MAG: hypothetical protein RL653_746 [Pseudomonadota bacterium]|jgi:hypothetical protein